MLRPCYALLVHPDTGKEMVDALIGDGVVQRVCETLHEQRAEFMDQMQDRLLRGEIGVVG